MTTRYRVECKLKYTPEIRFRMHKANHGIQMLSRRTEETNSSVWNLVITLMRTTARSVSQTACVTAILTYPAILAHGCCPRNSPLHSTIDLDALTQILEWVKGLLAVPFVLYSQPTGVFGDGPSITQMAEEAHRRYAEIMRDVELMIDDHSINPSLHKPLQHILSHAQFHVKATTAASRPS